MNVWNLRCMNVACELPVVCRGDLSGLLSIGGAAHLPLCNSGVRVCVSRDLSKAGLLSEPAEITFS